ncbi:MAG: protein kinase [Verrucomicrobia bacterium]|nr:protein kinase [Verrucomicrobiota bacterium]MBV8484880.1 protein kinase [Verrucomicrobiota bacterium]
MNADDKRVCPVCRVSFSASEEFCPVCAFRAALQPDSTSTELIDSSIPDLRLGHYEIRTHEDGTPIELGRGAMGITYKAFDVDLRRLAALKVISPHYLADESVRFRFLREARAAASVRHQNVASVFELGATGVNYFYAMEFVQGETLERLIKRSGRLEIKLALEIVIQIAAGLDAINKENLVHRDIKPSNIMVSLTADDVPSVKIIDLGLAKMLPESESQAAVSLPGAFAGTPQFASPEQFTGSEVDIRSDLYSLGVTLWQMLAGLPPFRGTPAEVMHQHLNAPLPLEQIKDEPQPVVALLEVLLAKDPAHRFQSPHQLLEAMPSVISMIETEGSIALQTLRRFPDQASSHRRITTKISRWRTALLPPFKTRVLLLSAIALVVGCGLIVGVRVFLGSRPVISDATATPGKSIAVLPFENISANKDDAYFADGVQDEILNNLARITQLKVISRTSVMQYRADTKRDLRQIAITLGVTNVLEGTVRRYSNQVRVSIELIDADNDHTVWADSYDRDLTDIFAIQSEIAQTVASKLRARLSSYERKDIEEKPTVDLEAYDLYLRAKELIANAELFAIGDERENLLSAISFLEQAVRKDSKFVLAYCLVARANDDLYLDIDRSTARRALGDVAVNEAVRLQPDLPQTRLAVARHLYYCYRDYGKVRAQIAIVQGALPNNSDALTLAAMADRREGLWDESTRGMQRAVSLDPRNPEVFTRLLENYMCLRHYQEAEKTCDRLLELGTDTPGFQVRKASIAFAEKADISAYRAALEALPPSAKHDMVTTADRMYAAALDHDWKAAKEILSDNSNQELIFFCGTAVPRACVEIWLAMVCGDHPTMEGRFGSARDELKQRFDQDQSDPKLLSALGIVDAALGRKDEAIEEAKRAVELQPISRDAMDGPSYVFSLAVVYAQTDQPDQAFEQLDILARTPSRWTSYGLFKLEPAFDPLRKDTRFDQLLAQLEPQE